MVWVGGLELICRQSSIAWQERLGLSRQGDWNDGKHGGDSCSGRLIGLHGLAVSSVPLHTMADEVMSRQPFAYRFPAAPNLTTSWIKSAAPLNVSCVRCA